MDRLSLVLGGSGTRLTGSIRPKYNIHVWETVQFTIDDEGLYDEPYVHAVVEIARCQAPITFQYRMDIRLIDF